TASGVAQEATISRAASAPNWRWSCDGDPAPATRGRRQMIGAQAPVARVSPPSPTHRKNSRRDGHDSVPRLTSGSEIVVAEIVRAMAVPADVPDRTVQRGRCHGPLANRVYAVRRAA